MMLRKGIFYCAENGKQVGPMRFEDDGSHGFWIARSAPGLMWNTDGQRYYAEDRGDGWDLISECTDEPQQTGPVRTVTTTKKVIDLGQYGIVKVAGTVDGSAVAVVYVANAFYDAAELRAAAATLTEIANALDEQAGAK